MDTQPITLNPRSKNITEGKSRSSVVLHNWSKHEKY